MGLLVAIAPFLIMWMASPSSGLTWPEATRLGGLLWLVANGVPPSIGPVTYTLVPYGLTLVPLLLLGYGGSWAARRARIRDWRDLVILVGGATVSYALIVGIAASLTARPGASVSTADAVLHGAVLAAIAVGFGATRGAGMSVLTALPASISTMVRAGLMGIVALLGAGAVAAGAALLVRVDDAVTMAQSLHAGTWGGLGLLMLGLAFAPVVIVWSTSYVLGAGFAIGPGIVVSAFIPVTSPTQLPPFPLLAAVPQSASPFAWALPVVGVAVGVLVGLSIARGARREARLVRLALAIGAATLTAVGMLAVSFLADGALGDVRLAHLGPSPTTVAVLAFVLVALGAVPSAVVPRPPARPDLVVAVEESPGESAVQSVELSAEQPVEPDGDVGGE
jgi:hypothetical protein